MGGSIVEKSVSAIIAFNFCLESALVTSVQLCPKPAM